MRVLVTGARGFIGRRAIALLAAAGHECLGIGRTALPDAPRGARFIPCDIFDQSDVRAMLMRERPTHLLHLAWVTTHGTFWQSPLNLDWLAASLQLVRAFADAGGERIVGAGSCAEYVWDGTPCDVERTALTPAYLYGVAKHALQMTVRAYAEQTTLSLAWGRVFFVYGPGEPAQKLVSSAIAELKVGRMPVSREWMRRLDFIHVDDVARAFASLVTSDLRGAVNIAGGDATSIGEVLRLLGASFGIAVEPSPLSARTAPDVEAVLTPGFAFRPTYDVPSGLAATVAALVPGR